MSNLRVLPAPKKLLLEQHREHLRDTSGLNDESIALNGFWSSSNATEISGLLNKRWRGRGAVLVLPFIAPGTTEPFYCRVRPDQPLTGKEDGKPKKYEQPWGVSLAPYFPARARIHNWYADTSRDIAFVEGEKKADILDQLEIATVGSCGVSAFHDVPHKKETEQWRLHEMILKHVALAGRRCLIVFDSDAAENDQVYRAAQRLAAMLAQSGAKDVVFVRIPHDGDKKLGIDDYFVKFGQGQTLRLLKESIEPIAPLGDDDARSIAKTKALHGIPLDPKLRLPPAYDIGKAGELIFTGGESAEIIERSALFIKRLVVDLYSGHEHAELVFFRHKKWRTVVVPRKAMVDSRALVSELGAIGAPIDTNSSSKVVKWLRDLEGTNERRLERAESVSRGGWHTVGGVDVFVIGEEILCPAGTKTNLVVDRQGERLRLTKGMRSVGTYEASIEALREAWKASPVAAATIAGALAAPMLRILRAPTFAVHLTGDSSRGKSSMLKIAASLYGDPRDEEWVSSWNSTAVGHEQRAAALSGLPLPIDESGVVDGRERERVVYMLMNGVGRTRGAKEGGLRETQQWQTVVLSTGEQKLTGENAATGAQVRVLHLNVSGFGDLDAVGVDKLRRAAETNYGHVGREWISTWIETDDAAREQHRAALKSVIENFQSQAHADSLRARQAQWWALLAYVEGVAHAVLGIGEEGGASIARLFSEPSDVTVTVRSACDRGIDKIKHWVASQTGSFPPLAVAATGGKVVKGGGRFGPKEICGYTDPEANELLILPASLRAYLKADDNIEDDVVLREWRTRGWLRTGEGDRYAVQMRIGGQRQRLIAVRGEAVGLELVPGAVPAEDEFGG